jgi:hypothetical protein
MKRPAIFGIAVALVSSHAGAQQQDMIGTYACIVGYEAGIQRKEQDTRPFVGPINPTPEKFILTISRHDAGQLQYLCNDAWSRGAFAQRCTGTHKAKMTPRVVTGDELYGSGGNIFYDDVPVGFFWIWRDLNFRAGSTVDVVGTYVKQGRCSRFGNDGAKE